MPSAPMFSSSYILSSSSTMMPGSTPPTPSAGEAAESPPILPQLVPLSPFTTTSMSSQDRWTASSSIPSPMPSASAQNAMLPGVHFLPQFSMRGLTNAKQAPPSDSPDIVAWFGAFPIRESTKCTDMLAGGMFTQAEIVEYNGKREAMFVFHVSVTPVSSPCLTQSYAVPRIWLYKRKARLSCATAQ